MERYLTAKEIGEMIGLSPARAKAYLLRKGLRPINLSAGKRCVHRWQESAVLELLENEHNKAQAARKTQRPKKPPKQGLRLSEMSVNDIYALTQRTVLQ